MSTSRRDFLNIIFGTMPAAAFVVAHPVLSSALSVPVWPEEKTSLPKHNPVMISIDDSGYLYDPNFDYDDIELPTNREHYDIDCMTKKERLEFHVDHHGIDYAHQIVEEALELDEPLKKITLKHLDIFDRYLENWLEEPIDPEYLSFRQSMALSEYWPGVDLVDELGYDRSKELGLALIEGECPGSSFSAVKYYGDDLGELNRAFFKEGINLQVAINS